MPNVTQGDMVHDDQPQMGRNALREKTRLWPNATIPVVFHQDFGNDYKMYMVLTSSFHFTFIF